MSILNILLEVPAQNGDYFAQLLGAIALLGSGGGWVKLFVDKATMRQSIDTLEKEAEKTEKDLRERILDISASKKGMRRHFETQIEHLQNEIKEERNNNKKEFEKINIHLLNIEGILGEIKGKLDK